MQKKILISACLLGKNCRFNGGNSLIQELESADVEWIAVCPEEEGGLGTPRPAAEMQADAEDIINNKGSVINITGRNITEQFIKGARESLKKGFQNNTQFAILKSHSPSCGIAKVYDGNFSGKLRKGDGIFAHLCREKGFTLISSDDTNQIKKTLKKLK